MVNKDIFQSTLPVWGATCAGCHDGDRRINFNPRSPCGERHLPMTRMQVSEIFQSTLPVWGATQAEGQFPLVSPHFNPRSPCGERRNRTGKAERRKKISIHAPRVGSDLLLLLRLPLLDISIHAPRVGSDEDVERITDKNQHFNPRSPCGERPVRLGENILDLKFQSTLPVWGATGLPDGPKDRTDISIHAPRVGSDGAGQVRPFCQVISIHAPRVGSDKSDQAPNIDQTHFNPRSPCGERPGKIALWRLTHEFQSTLPVWGATFCNLILPRLN